MTGNKDKTFWKLMAIDYATPLIHPISYMLATTSSKISRIIGVKKIESTLFEAKEEKPEQTKFRWCYVEKDFIKHAKIIINKLNKNPNFFKKINRQSKATIAKNRNYIQWLFKQDLSLYPNKKLFEAYSTLFELMIDMNIWGHIVNLVDFHHNMLTNKLMGFLNIETFGILTTPIEKSPLQKQEEDFYKLLSQIQKNKKSIDKAAKEYKQKYDWLEFHYSGPTILEKEYFVELFRSEIKQKVDGKEKLKELKEKTKKLTTNQRKISKELGLSKKELYWIDVAKTFMLLKALRKDTVFEISRLSDPLIREIGKRLELSPSEIRFMNILEIKDALLREKVDKNLINRRTKYSIWIVDKNKIKVITDKEAKICSKRIIEEKAEEETNEFKGTPACVGHVKGAAKIIIGANDMSKMNGGDILVSPATNPNLMPAIKKAGAIITDEGGITCHAAIVSRELNIPCIVGTKIATAILRDGDLVEVDANKGVVRILKK